MRALAVLGMEVPEGGMYQYLRAWVEQESSNGVIVTNKAIASSFDDVEAHVFSTLIEHFRYSLYPVCIIFGVLYFSLKIRSVSKSLALIGIDELRILDDFAYSSYFIFIFSLFFKGKIVVTVHDPIPHQGHIKGFISGLIYTLNRKLMLIIFRRGRAVLHVHNLKLVQGTEWESLENILEEPHPLPRARIIRSRAYDEKIRFLFAGRIEPYKGLERFLAAIDCIADRYKETFLKNEFYIVGRGGDAELLARYEKYSNVVVDNKFIDEDTFHRYVANSDCMLLSYYSATSSGVGSLAITYDIPVIASQLPELALIAQNDRRSKVVSPVCTAGELALAMCKFSEQESRGYLA